MKNVKFEKLLKKTEILNKKKNNNFKQRLLKNLKNFDF